MKINMRKVLKSLILGVTMILMIYIYINGTDIKSDIDMWVILTFFINCIIIIINILLDKRKYSLNKTFWYFSLFFLFLAPLLQYISDYDMWNYHLTNEQYIKCNMWLVIWFLIYSFINRNIKINFQKTKSDNRVWIKKSIVYMLLLLSLISLILGIYFIGFKNLFIKSENDIDLGAGNISLIVINLIRSIPTYSTVYSMYYYKKNKRGIVYVVISFVITFLLNYPASVTRYWIGAIYIGILLVILKKQIKDKTFDLGMIIVLAVIFPMFQLFKWYNIEDLLNGNIRFKNLMTVYNNPDFDAYSMFARTFKYVEVYSITYGKQLFSTLFFFIPRSIWINKSVPSGQLVAQSQGQIFTNLSSPLIAEGYINFGYLGIIIYSVIIAILIKFLDNAYWDKEDDNISTIDFVYPFAIGFLIFLLRGAFHPAIVYMFTFYLALIGKKLFQKIYEFIKRAN